jgi:hypothetical protein
MKTQHKILAMAAGLAAAGALLAGLAVRLGPENVRSATVVAQSGVAAAFTSGLVAAFSGPAARGIDARRQEAGPESELLRLKQE